jgi:hypothetical protein
LFVSFNLKSVIKETSIEKHSFITFFIENSYRDVKMGEHQKEEPEPNNQQAGFMWTPEIIKDFEKFLIDLLGTNLADKFLENRKNDAEAGRHYFESVAKHNRNMIYVLICFLTGIVAFMSSLTLLGRVSGDALLFLVGTITGYVLLFIQRLVFPAKEIPTTEEKPT